MHTLLKGACSLAAILGVLHPLAFSAEPATKLVLNGGFDNGMQYWKGEGKIVTLPDGNKVCQVDASEQRVRGITQNFRLQNIKEIEITFRARSISYKGSGLHVTLETVGISSQLWNRELPVDGSWGEYRFKHTRAHAEDHRALTLAANLGSGSIQFDNVEVHELTTAIAAANMPALDRPPAPPGEEVRGSFPAAYQQTAQELRGSKWNWKSTNAEGVSLFEQNGQVIEESTGKPNGDWIINEDGSLTYRRGTQLGLIWHLKRVDESHFTGLGIGGGAINKICSLTRGDPRPATPAEVPPPVPPAP